MKKFIILSMLLIASPALAHDCCCGGMGRLSAETVRKLKLEQFDIQAAYARRMVKAYGNLRDGMALDSPWYPGVKKAYEYWLGQLEGMQEKAIDEADWKRIDADMDEAADSAYRKVR